MKEWLNQNYTAQRRENIEIVDLKGIKMSRDTNKYKYKKEGDINRRNRKQKREKDKRNSGKKNNA